MPLLILRSTDIKRLENIDMNYIEQNSELIRFVCFVFAIVFFFLYEIFFPFYKKYKNNYSRLIINFLFIIVDAITVRILFPVLTIGAAVICTKYNIGILNLLSLPLWFSIIISIFLLDLGIWLQHYIFHYNCIFWRFHKIHHSDYKLDFSSALRFHPIEIILSTIIKSLYIFIIGAPILSVIIFEIILNGISIYNHSNIYMPKKFELILRKILVTPSMHRIHHSIIKKETNSNFGFIFSIWDKIFNTYCHITYKEEKNLIMGLEEFHDIKNKSFLNLLTIPFKYK